MPDCGQSHGFSEADRLRLKGLLWKDARKHPEDAERTWGTLLASSLRIPLTREARQRLEWFLAYNTKFKGNAMLTCRHFGISRKTFYRWKKKFDVLNPRSLEDGSHRPKSGPLPVLNLEQNERLFSLRFAHPYYSKMKIAALYERKWGKKISSWQAQKVIERYLLYPDIKRARRIAFKRLHAAKKNRITKFIKEPRTGFLVCIDTVILDHANKRFYMLTALDTHSRWGFARVYGSHGSKAAADFLRLLHRDMRGTIQNIQTDNGSEFGLYFQKALQELKLRHFWSRVRTPKDNAQLERFNRTIREECLPPWTECTDVSLLNCVLIQWLDDYNFERPHMALKYRTPAEAAWSE